MNLFLISAIDCSDTYMQTVITIVKNVLTAIQWAVPIILMILGTFDMFKAVSTNDDKATKEAQKRFGKRLIYAIVIFLMPLIIKFTFSLASTILNNDDGTKANNTVTQFFACWNGNTSGGNSDIKSCRTANGVSVAITDEQECLDGGFIWD